MVSTTCGWCSTKSHMTSLGTGSSPTVAAGVLEDDDQFFIMAPYSCDNCYRLSIAAAYPQTSYGNVPLMTQLEDYSEIEWLPVAAVGRDYPDVPTYIRSAANEVHRCVSIGAYRAAVQLARSTIEAAAKERGFVKGSLETKIDQMFDKGLLRPHVKDAAHEVRHLGNDMAHGDFVLTVSEAEATEVVGLMAELLDEVFQSPARVARRRAARLGRSKP